LGGIVELTETVMGWQGKDIGEREGGHLQAWLKWLKDAADDDRATIREAREMLSAALGVEPPPPIGTLVEESQRKRSFRERYPRLMSILRVPAPKMPLFALLSVMFVAQAIFGWMWVRKINENINKELKVIKLSIYDSPYTADRNPEREEERGSKPVSFDE